MKPYPPQPHKLYIWAWWAFTTVKERLWRHPKLYPLAYLMEFIVGIVALWFYALLALGLMFLVLTQPLGF